MREAIDQLFHTQDISDQDLRLLLESQDSEVDEMLRQKAEQLRTKYYGTNVYIRGLIELSSYCKNDCYYCGIRNGNTKATRYRLTEAEILECCKEGYSLGFRTFVLQGGEDPFFTDEKVISIIREIKMYYPDCAVTLSLGEKSYQSYQAFYEAGADRYLLRHETASASLYKKLHPASMDFYRRKQCLFDLKDIGYQVGAGFMVGLPFQETKHLVEDFRFLQQLQPAMIGIGPFLAHQQTPFKDYPNGSLYACLRILSILRLLFPSALIPATTAMGTIDEVGRELALRAGANVVMPNLSPVAVRKFYELYDDKICTGEEAAECRHCLDLRVRTAGYEIVVARGDQAKL